MYATYGFIFPSYYIFIVERFIRSELIQMVWHSNQSQIKGAKGKREEKKQTATAKRKIIQKLYIHRHQNRLLASTPWDYRLPLSAMQCFHFKAHVYMHAYISQMTITTINRRGEQNPRQPLLIVRLTAKVTRVKMKYDATIKRRDSSPQILYVRWSKQLSF